MLALNSAIAKKHVDISINVKQIADKCCQHCRVYVATHTTGIPGQSFQRIERESNEEFWSIKAWTSIPPRHRLKDPDVIITKEKQVTFLVEVKWGTVPGNATTDLLISPKEQEKMARLLHGAAMCRVKGPAVRGGHRYRSPLPLEGEYQINSKTRFVFVSDFFGVKQTSPTKFQDFLTLWKNADLDFLIADINTRVGEIPSFQEIVETQGYTPLHSYKSNG